MSASLVDLAREATAPETPVDLVVCYDYQCPYSARAVRWLEGLGLEVVRPTYRMFSLEQVNVDPDAAEWRIWEQPLDHPHYRGRQDRRSLPAFLLTAMLEEGAANGTLDSSVVRAFRLAVYRTRFEEAADIADMAVLRRVAIDAGVPGERLDALISDPAAEARARTRIAADWAATHGEAAVFGVPTLILPGDRPMYLRLAREPGPDEAADLLRRIVELRRSAPWVLELKLAEGPVT